MSNKSMFEISAIQNCRCGW